MHAIFNLLGLPKGNFLLRNRVKKPGHQPEIGNDPEFYAPKDLYVGNIININGYSFQLIDADEFSLCYMEANKHLVSLFMYNNWRHTWCKSK